MIQFNWKLFFLPTTHFPQGIEQKFVASVHHHKTKNFSPHFSKIETVRKTKNNLRKKTKQNKTGQQEGVPLNESAHPNRLENVCRAIIWSIYLLHAQKITRSYFFHRRYYNITSPGRLKCDVQPKAIAPKAPAGQVLNLAIFY